MDYWPIFESFVRAELDAHGPDHQLQLLLELAPDVSDIEKVWLIGCYCTHHNVASAYAMWGNFRPEEVIDNPKRLLLWMEKYWNSLPVRPEMHSHRIPEKRWECAVDFAMYSIGESWRINSYEKIWDEAIESVRFFNRYLAIKFLEMIRRTVRPDLILSDIRAQNGWSPRAAIAMLYPEMAYIIGDKHNNSFEAVWYAEEHATEIKNKLKANGINISYYQLQVLCCNFKQCIQGRVAPGSGHEAERTFMRIAEKHFDMSHVYRTRQRIFNHIYLSETPNFQGLKKDEWRRRVKELELNDY
jgi:hypothetical protein